MQKYFLLALALLAFASTASATTPTLVGGDRDTHGCIGSAGYKWSAPMKQCIRSWEHYSLDIETPPTTGVARFDAMIARKADSLTQKFRHDAEEDMVGFGTGEIDPDRYMLDVSYTVVSTGAIVSVKMDVYQYTGGAHGSATIYTWNYDRKTGKILPITKLLSPTDLSKVATKVRTALIKYYSDAGYDLDTEWLATGTNPKFPRNYGTYTVMLSPLGKPEKITVYFADYQVGPHAIGMPTVLVMLPSLSVTSGNE